MDLVKDVVRRIVNLDWHWTISGGQSLNLFALHQDFPLQSKVLLTAGNSRGSFYWEDYARYPEMTFVDLIRKYLSEDLELGDAFSEHTVKPMKGIDRKNE